MIRPLLLSSIPFYGAWKELRERPKRPDGLTALRSVFVGMVAALPLFLLPLFFIAPWNGRGESAWALGLVVLLGTIGLFRVRTARNRPLRIESTERLASSYRANFFIGVGHSVAPSVVAFIGTFFANKLWLYLVGLAFGFLGFALIAPTRADIERRQQQIAAQGSSLSLLEVLMAPPSRDQRDEAS